MFFYSIDRNILLLLCNQNKEIMKKIYLLVLCLPLILNAQDYTEINTNITPLIFAAADFADFDNDGDQDLAVIGVNADFADMTKIYRNDNGVFTDILAALPPMHMGALNWVDYDSDGDFDLFCSGQDYASTAYAALFKNTNGVFTNALVNLPLGFWNSAGWGDYDNDGDLDLAYSWYAENVGHSTIFRNDGGSFVDIGFSMQGLTAGSMEWGDFDSDGDLDLLHTGTTTDFSKTPVNLYINEEGNFSLFQFPFLDCAWYNNVLWSDIDNDGDLDIVYVADEDDQYYFVYYENIEGSFELNYTGLDGVRTSNGNIGLVQGDIDNDGDVDFVMTGDNPNYAKSTKIYINNNGAFTALDHSIPGFGSGSLDLTDLDNDGDLDLYMTGYDPASNADVGVFINNSNSNTYSLNEAPQPPSELSVELDGNSVLLSWQPATDDHTPQESLTYNLYVGSSPGSADIICAQSVINSDQENFGFHFVPKPGNGQMSLQHMISQLADGQYYWSVQAIDQSGVPSVFAEEQSFQVGDVTQLNTLEAAVQVYPNPATDFVWVKETEAGFSIEIYNISGQLIFQQKATTSQLQLDLSGYSSGNYLIKVNNGNSIKTEELHIVR